MEDITPQTSQISSDQAEAVKHVRGAQLFNISGDQFKQSKSELQPEVDKLSRPPLASPIVARNISSDPEKAAALAPDTDLLSTAENMWSDFKAGVDKNEQLRQKRETENYHKISQRLGPQQELNDLYWKKLNGDGKLSPDEELQVASLKDQTQGDPTNPPGTFLENLPSDVVGGIVDMVATPLRHKALMAGIMGTEMTATGAAAAATTAATGGAALPAVIPGMMAAAVPSAWHGFLATALVDGYQNAAAQMYRQLEDQTTPDGKPIPVDERNKKYLAHGMGMVAGLLNVGSQYLLFKNTPFFKEFTRNGVAIIADQANSQLRNGLISLGKSAAIMGATGGLQQTMSILGEEIGHTSNGDQVSVTNGILNAVKRLGTKEGATEVGKATVTSALTGATIHTLGEIIGDKHIPSRPGDEAKGVGPIDRPKLPGGPSDIVEPNNPSEKAIEVMKFKDTVDAASKVTENTGLEKLDPSQIKDLNKQIFQEHGPEKVFFDKEDLNKAVKDESAAKKVRDAIDPSGVAAARLNQPVSMSTEEMLDLKKNGIDLSEHARLHPEGPSPDSAEEYLKRLQANKQKRQEIQNRLDIGEKSPEERAYAIPQLSHEIDNETLVKSLGSQEVADAYLERLGVEKVAAKGNKEELSRIKTLKQRVTDLRDNLPKDQTVKETLTKALKTPQPMNDVFGEEDFMSKPMLTPTVEGLVPEKDLLALEEEHSKAKQAIVDSINDAAEYEMNKVIDVNNEIAKQTRLEIEAEKIKNDPDIAIVDKFYNETGHLVQSYPEVRGSGLKTSEELTSTHHKPGYSPFAIDPRMLTPDQMRQYRKDPMLKKHKVFIEGGLSPDESARLVGVNGGDNLLKLLSKTPTRAEAIKANAKKFEVADLDKVKDSVDLNHIAIAKAYHNEAAINLKIMKKMIDVNNNAAATKAGIKLISLPVPRVEELQQQAEKTVQQIKIGDLNPNIFKVGARKSQRLAVQAYLKGDMLKTATNKEAQALNNELTLAAHIATAQVNRTIKFLRVLKKPKTQEILRDAGKVYQDAYNELVDVYNLDPSKKGSSKPGSFDKFVAQQVEAGNDNFKIPERLQDTRVRLKDMTVEELTTVGDRLRSILHQAKMFNKLYSKFGPEAQAEENLKDIVQKLVAISEAHPDYNDRKSITPQDMKPIEGLTRLADDLLSRLRNMEHILLNADNGKVGGLYNEVVAMLKGVGKYSDGGAAGKSRDMLQLKQRFAKIIEKFNGEKSGLKRNIVRLDEWSQLENTKVKVPEFAGNPHLGDGEVSKARLFMMLLNSGNQGNIDRLTGGLTFKRGKGEVLASIDHGTIMDVLRRELDEKHFEAAQDIWNTFKFYRSRVVALHEKVTGVTPKMVEALPIEGPNGKMYEGGYFPLIGEAEMSLEKIRRQSKLVMESTSGEGRATLKDKMYADDMTIHRHTEERTGSVLPLNLSMNAIGMGFEMIIHDLNFRIPIADALKIVSHPEVMHALASTVGLPDTNVVLNTIIDAASSTQMDANALYDSGKAWEKLQSHVKSGIAAAYLVGNISSHFIQPDSMFYALNRLGLNGQKHVLKILQQFQNPAMIGPLFDFAGEVHSAIRDFRENLDENARDSISKEMPMKNWHTTTAVLQGMRNFTNDAGFRSLGYMDQLQKVIIASAAYSQFMAGDAAEHPLEEIMKLSREERDHRAKVYASSAARLTLTTGDKLDKSIIQKKHTFLAMFQNDPRNSLNNTFRQIRDIRHGVKKGDYSKIAMGVIGLFVTAALARLWQDIIRGYDTPFSTPGYAGSNPDFKRLDPDSINDPDFAKNLLTYVATSPIDMISGDIIGLRDINYRFQTDDPKKPKEVQNLIGKFTTDVYNTWLVAYNFMDIYRGDRDVSEKEKKSIGFTLSYALGGAPVNAFFKLVHGIQDAADSDAVHSMTSGAEDYMKKLDQFKKDFGHEVSEKTIEVLEKIGRGFSASSFGLEGIVDKPSHEAKD